MAPLEPKPPDPWRLCPPLIPGLHCRFPPLVKAIATRLAPFQSSIEGSALETFCSHGALEPEIGASCASIVTVPNHQQQSEQISTKTSYPVQICNLVAIPSLSLLTSAGLQKCWQTF